MTARWTRLALADLTAARDYIAKESPEAAGRVVERIEGSVKNLGRHPALGRPGRVEGTRELVVPGTPFFVAYRICGDSIEVLALVHGARRWP